MTAPETKFKNKVLVELRRIPKSWWVKVQQVSISGTPDILGCIGPYFVAIELKRAEHAHATSLQLYNLLAITQTGSRSFLTSPETWAATYAELLEISSRAG